LKTVRFIYIHGFASGPGSRKAEAFHAALGRHGISLEIPAMDEGDFAHLTISGQLSLLERTLAGEPAHLIGSSMGGYLAALYASEHPEIQKVVLLAPAFGFAARWRDKARQIYGNGEPPAAFEVYHYGEKRMRQVHFRLIEDALVLPPAPDFRQPALIFHGTHDDTAPIGNSREFAAEHSNAHLVELDSDHELLNVLDAITNEAVEFLLPGLR
jgi:uncharacterized protein